MALNSIEERYCPNCVANSTCRPVDAEPVTIPAGTPVEIDCGEVQYLMGYTATQRLCLNCRVWYSMPEDTQ